MTDTSQTAAHARRELTLVGEEPAMIDWYCRVIDEFMSFGHSGGSGSVAIPTLNALLQQHALTPLTVDPDEWQDRTVECSGVPTWQNRRDGRAFSPDGGATYTMVDDDTRTVHHSAEATR